MSSFFLYTSQQPRIAHRKGFLLQSPWLWSKHPLGCCRGPKLASVGQDSRAVCLILRDTFLRPLKTCSRPFHLSPVAVYHGTDMLVTDTSFLCYSQGSGQSPSEFSKPSVNKVSHVFKKILLKNILTSFGNFNNLTF